MTVYLLCDNGSLKPDATLRLRTLAGKLSQASGVTVHPVSLMHASKIPTEQLDGLPAVILPDFLDQQLVNGIRHFRIIPLFFGFSNALSAYIPQQVQALIAKHGHFSLTIADVLSPLPEGEPKLAQLLLAHIRQTASDNALPERNIVLVDHGSPEPRVTAVREQIAEAISVLSGAKISPEQAVMERRNGKAYDFNGERLEDWLLSKARSGESSAIVTLLFLLPGRHAGPGGDIETICQSVMERYPAFNIAISPLVAEHPALIDILLTRL